LERVKLQEEEQRKFSEVSSIQLITSQDNNNNNNAKPVHQQQQQQVSKGSSALFDLKSPNNLDAEIALNVGGVIYRTTLRILRSKPCTLLALMFSGDYDLVPMHQQSNTAGAAEQQVKAPPMYFIDRNGKLFRYVLDYLRDGVVVLPRYVNFLARNFLWRENTYCLNFFF